LCPGFQKERRILELERLMTAAVDLHFEDAAELRDEIEKLKKSNQCALSIRGGHLFASKWRNTGNSLREPSILCCYTGQKVGSV